jgi:hypothetical protein
LQQGYPTAVRLTYQGHHQHHHKYRQQVQEACAKNGI